MYSDTHHHPRVRCNLRCRSASIRRRSQLALSLFIPWGRGRCLWGLCGPAQPGAVAPAGAHYWAMEQHWARAGARWISTLSLSVCTGSCCKCCPWLWCSEGGFERECPVEWDSEVHGVGVHGEFVAIPWDAQLYSCISIFKMGAVVGFLLGWVSGACYYSRLSSLGGRCSGQALPSGSSPVGLWCRGPHCGGSGWLLVYVLKRRGQYASLW